MTKESKRAYSVPGIFFEVIKVKPVIFILQYIISTVGSVLLGLFTAYLQNVFNNAVTMVERPSVDNIQSLLISLLILFVLKYGSEGLEILNGYVGTICYNRCAAHFIQLYNQKVSKVRAITFESEAYLDLYTKALEGATAGRGMLHVIMDVFALYLPYFVTISIYLAKQDPSLLIVLVFAAVPILATNKMKKAIYAKLHNEAAKEQRRKEEYAKYLSSAPFNKEVRVNLLFPFFYKKYQNARKTYNSIFILAERKKLLMEVTSKAIELICFLGAVVLLILRLIEGSISIGAFGAIFYSLDEVYSLMEEVLISRVSEYSRKLPALKAFINLMNSKEIEQELSTANEKFEEISLEHVSFTYPNAQQPSLSDVCLTIRKNDKVAIVGYNGSGKSTLAKILLGLYIPTSGSIKIDNKEINRMNPLYVSAIFQDFNRYKETVINNVKISKLTIDSDIMEEKLNVGDALRKVGLDFSEWGDSETILQTLCAREFGGIDLSGGEWQKLATARMLYRDRNFVVLDEPTSQVDPISEYEFNNLLEKELQQKTAIIITHRMASVRFCNKIIVLKDGKVVAIGNHEDLMKSSPLYYELYHSVKIYYE